MSARTILAFRREGWVVTVEHARQQCAVAFNFDQNYTRICECFCSPAAFDPSMPNSSASKGGADFQALIVDGCIAISLLLQHGMTLTALNRSFGEDRQEGAKTGPPSSALGAIVRAGIALESEIQP